MRNPFVPSRLVETVSLRGWHKKRAAGHGERGHMKFKVVARNLKVREVLGPSRQQPLRE